MLVALGRAVLVCVLHDGLIRRGPFFFSASLDCNNFILWLQALCQSRCRVLVCKSEDVYRQHGDRAAYLTDLR